MILNVIWVFFAVLAVLLQFGIILYETFTSGYIIIPAWIALTGLFVTSLAIAVRWLLRQL